MKLETFIVICLVIHLISRWMIHPSLRKAALSDDPAVSMRAGAKLATWGLASSAAVVAAVAALLFLLVVKSLQAGKPDALESIKALHLKLAAWSDRVAFLSQGWLIFAALIVLAGIAIYLHRRSLVSFRNAYDRLVQREIDRISQQAEDGTLPDLPPTAEMQTLLGHYQEAGEKIGALEELARENKDLEGEARKAIEQLGKHQEEIIGHVRVMDLTRRMNLKLNPDDIGLPPAEGFWEKLGTVFISRGMVTSLSRSARWIVLSLAALAAVSLIGIGVNSQRDGIAHRIESLQEQAIELELATNREKAKESYDAALQQLSDAPDQLSEEEVADLADEASAQFEAQWIHARIGNPSVKVDAFARAAAAAKGSIVRQQILKDHAARNPAVEFQGEISATALADEARTSEAFARADASRKKPVTETGKALSQDLRTYMRKKGDAAVSQIKSGLASLQKEVRASDLSWTVSRELAGEALAHGKGRPPSLDAAFEAARHDSFAKTTAGAPLDTSFGRDSMPEFFTAEQMEENNRYMGRHVDAQQRIDSLSDMTAVDAPSLKTRTNPDMTRSAAKSATKMFSRAGGGDASFRFSEFSMEYGNHFPATSSDANSGLYGELVEKWQDGDQLAREATDWKPYESGGGGGGGGGGTSSKPRPIRSAVPSAGKVTASVNRARSFTRLRGFSRIGGVLIGRPAEGEGGELPNDIRWTFPTPGTCRLELVFADGKSLRFKSMDADLVYRALAYAADGRPATVTMVSAPPIPELKILLHPALLNSRLGNEIIELDRYVDTYARGESTAVEEGLVTSAHAAYQIAWAARFRKLLPAFLEKYQLRDEDTLALKRIGVDAEALLADPELAEAAKAALNATVEQLDAGTPLAKKDFYDEALVREIRSYLMPAGGSKNGVPGLIGHIESAATKATLFDTFYLPPPQFQVWSGVREKAYAMNASEMIVTEDGPPADTLRFMIQVAFTSAPAFGVHKGSEDYNDEDPWEFKALAPHIQQRISQAQKDDPAVRRVCARAGDFVLLQRLFRNALDGNFETAFPLEKLSALADEAAKQQPAAEPTPVWNLRPGLAESVVSQALLPLQISDQPAPVEELVKRLQAMFEEQTERGKTFRKAILSRLSQGTIEGRATEKWGATWQADWQAHQEENARGLAKMQAEVEAFRKEHTVDSKELVSLEYALDLLEVRQNAGLPGEEPHWWLKRTPQQAKEELSRPEQ